MDMIDNDLTREYKDRLADRYTAMELVEILDVAVEDIIEEYWELILRSHPLLLQEVGMGVDSEELS